MDADETIPLFSGGILQTEVFEIPGAQVEAAEGGTERHQMLLPAIPSSMKTLMLLHIPEALHREKSGLV